MRESIRISGLAVAVLLLAIVLQGCPAGRPATVGDALKGREAVTSYEVTVTPASGRPVTQLVKLDEGKPARMKMDEGEQWVIVDMTEETMYAYDPQQRAALKLSLAEGGMEDEDMPVRSADEFDPEVAITGGESVDEVACWVFETTGEEEAEAAKVWLDKEYGLVRQIEQAGELTKFDYSRINAVPDSEFEVPEGVKVMDMAEMMQGMMQGMPEMPAEMPEMP